MTAEGAEHQAHAVFTLRLAGSASIVAGALSLFSLLEGPSKAALVTLGEHTIAEPESMTFCVRCSALPGALLVGEPGSPGLCQGNRRQEGILPAWWTMPSAARCIGAAQD